MKRIIHLSDIHIGYDGLARRFEHIVERLIFTKKPANNYIVVITGDIADDATKDGQYAQALSYLQCLKEAGFLVLLIPGNHDYGTGSFGFSKYVSKFKQAFYGTDQVTYPKLDLIDDIAFIGLDSMAEELHWYDRLSAEGELGKVQLDKLNELLLQKIVVKTKYRVVYLHHHPFHPLSMHQLKDSNKLEKVLRKHKIDALLFGHNHDGKVWNGVWGIARAYDAGSCTGKKGLVGPHRVIKLDQGAFFDYDAKF